MSDFSQGPGWWQASDGKWYPPEASPGTPPPPQSQFPPAQPPQAQPQYPQQGFPQQPPQPGYQQPGYPPQGYPQQQYQQPPQQNNNGCVKAMLIFFAICTVLALGVGACTIVIANEAGDAINEFEESGGFEQFEEAIEEATEELEEAAEAMEEEVNADDIGGGQGEPAPPPTGDELGETTCVVSSTNVATVTFDSYVDALADFDFVIELYDADGTALRDGEVSISNVTPLGTSTFPFPLLGVAAATCEVISIEQTS